MTLYAMHTPDSLAAKAANESGARALGVGGSSTRTPAKKRQRCRIQGSAGSFAPASSVELDLY